MAGWSSWSSFCLLFFLFIGKVTGELVNRTIDDMYGDYAATDKNGRGEVAYYPEPSWWHQGEGAQCPGCAVGRPPGHTPGEPLNFGNSSGPQNGTWHELLNDQLPQNPVVEVTFVGSAIYLYAILFAYSTTNVSVELDGQRMPDFYYQGQNNPIIGPKWRYDQIIYANDGLVNGKHTVRMTNMRDSEFMFDYATYTVEVSSKRPQSVPIALIVGATVGGVVFIGLAIGILVFHRRHRLQYGAYVDSDAPAPIEYGKATPYPLSFSDVPFITDSQCQKNGPEQNRPPYGTVGSVTIISAALSTSSARGPDLTSVFNLRPDNTSVFELRPDNTSVFHLRSPS
ncbi:hypothetical protein DL96DRAFT_1685125 [Flagelloscypha sp. PMI_526]|nr:hypothetical protein DL96DRAFT_1685125 [Flagelloscypha sp. PMI_526]